MAKDSSINRLIEIMDKLRDSESGCPWDLEQNHDSLKRYVIEEAYEVTEAVDSGDAARLCDELGDLLLQIVFHARIANENGEFDFSDVAEAISGKMVKRHPHIFGGPKLESSSEVVDQWEVIKRNEAEGRNSLLDGIPTALPALAKAHRVQERVSRVGFDWSKMEDVLAKLQEEVDEFRAAVLTKKIESMEDEFGDILFSLVNLSRFMKIDPESALQKATSRFTSRFRFMETRLEAEGRDPSEMTLVELDRVWEEAKTAGE